MLSGSGDYNGTERNLTIRSLPAGNIVNRNLIIRILLRLLGDI